MAAYLTGYHFMRMRDQDDVKSDLPYVVETARVTEGYVGVCETCLNLVYALSDFYLTPRLRISVFIFEAKIISLIRDKINSAF